MARGQNAENLDNIFAFNQESQGETEALLKQAKGKSTRRVVAISLLVVVTILALGAILKMQITPNLIDREIMEQEYYYSLYGANSYLADWEEDYRLIGSGAETTLYKMVEGVPVILGQVGLQKGAGQTEIHGGQSEDWLENQYEDVYGLNGQKISQFFAPGVAYEAYSNDWARIKAMGPEKVLEMGLSFDQGYTFSQIQALLPEGVHLAWAWIDTYGDQEPMADGRGLVLLGDGLLGFDALDKVGVPYEDPLAHLKMTLEIGMKSSKTYGEEMSDLYAQLGGAELSEEKVPIIGIVVTGTVADISALEGLAMIKAASLGAVADKY